MDRKKEQRIRSRDEQIASLNRHLRWDAKGKAELFISEAESRATLERDLLIRDLRKELNEHRYGRSAEK